MNTLAIKTLGIVVDHSTTIATCRLQEARRIEDIYTKLTFEDFSYLAAALECIDSYQKLGEDGCLLVVHKLREFYGYHARSYTGLSLTRVGHVLAARGYHIYGDPDLNQLRVYWGKRFKPVAPEPSEWYFAPS